MISVIASYLIYKMKNFFNKVKSEIKFAKAGEGHKLTEDTRSRPSSSHASSGPPLRTQGLAASQVQAGSAALSRYDAMTKQPKTVRPKVVRNNFQSNEAGPSSSSPSSSSTPVPQEAPDDDIAFVCPFTNDPIRKSNFRDHLEEQLLLKLDEDPVLYSSLMIRNLHRNEEEVQAAINTLFKYLDNICNKPDETKYRRIRRNNRVFNERVASVKGTTHFLQAIGFQTKTEEDNEEYFVLGEEVDIERIKSAQQLVESTERIVPNVYRDPLVISSEELCSQNISNDGSEEFYKLTSAEVKRMQQTRTKELELSRTLRTRAMREVPTHNYKYATIRVRFPDAKLLQGTFRSRETVGDLKTFVREHINVEWAVFTLTVGGQGTLEDDNVTLSDANLAPSAVVQLAWNEEIRQQVLEQQGIQLSVKEL